MPSDILNRCSNLNAKVHETSTFATYIHMCACVYRFVYSDFIFNRAYCTIM